MIKFVAEWLIDWIVVMFIIVVGLFIVGIGFVFYPFKKIRYFCGEKATHLMDVADYFLETKK